MEIPLLTKRARNPHETEGVKSCDPCGNKSVRNYIEFVLTLVQIIAAIVLITREDDEHPESILLEWLIGYTFGCIAVLPILCWRFWQYSGCVSSESSINGVMNCLRQALEFLFVGWFVWYLWTWVYITFSLPPDEIIQINDNIQLLGLCMPFIAYNWILYVYPDLKCAAISLVFPLVDYD